MFLPKYSCAKVLIQRVFRCIFKSVHAKIQDNPMLLASTENVLSCTKSKCVLIQKVFRRIQTCWVCRLGSEQIQGNPIPPATTHYRNSITLECTTLMMMVMAMVMIMIMMVMVRRCLQIFLLDLGGRVWNIGCMVFINFDFHGDCLKQLHIISFILFFWFSFALNEWWYQKCLRKYSGDILLFFLPKMCLVICGGVEDKQLTT